MEPAILSINMPLKPHPNMTVSSNFISELINLYLHNVIFLTYKALNDRDPSYLKPYLLTLTLLLGELP